MDTHVLQDYLLRQFPLAQAMAVQVEDITPDALSLAAPLAPNSNHQQTLFGGSGVTLCILACWSLLYCRLQAAALAGEIVIQRQQMHYQRPASADVWAEAQFIDETDWFCDVVRVVAGVVDGLGGLAAKIFSAVASSKMESRARSMAGFRQKSCGIMPCAR